MTALRIAGPPSREPEPASSPHAFSLRRWVLLWSLGTALLLIGASLLTSLGIARQAVLKHAHDVASAQAGRLVAAARLGPAHEALVNELLLHDATSQPLGRVLITGANGLVQLSTHTEDLGRPLPRVAPVLHRLAESLHAAEQEASQADAPQATVWLARRFEQRRNEPGAVADAPAIVGVEVQAEEWLQARQQQVVQEHAIERCVLLAALGLLLWALDHRVLRPLQGLRAHAHALGQGELQRQAPPMPAAELAQLGQAIDHMAGQLHQHRGQLEQQVAERTMELAHQRDMAQASARAKSEFLTNISHELRTPLNAVLGLAHLAQRQAHAEQAANLHRLSQAAQQLHTVLSDVLDMARLDAGRMRLQPVPTPVASALHSACEPFELQARAKGLAWDLVLQPGLPDTLMLDEARVRQVLGHLVGNALKFTAQGGVRVVAQARHGSLRMEVHDSGPGVESAQLQRLLRPFEQGDASSTRRHGGTGLGLALSQGLLALMGSSLHCRRADAGGSIFYFDLPLRETPGQPKPPCPAREAAGAQPSPGGALNSLQPDCTTQPLSAMTSAHANQHLTHILTSLVPGIRPELGLRSVRGNEEAYLRLLERFAQVHAGDAQQARALAVASQADALHELAHPLKGTAGAVGAMEVAACAAAISRHDAPAELQAKAEQLATQLDALLRGLAAALPQLAKSGQSASAQEPRPGPPRDAATVRAELLQALARRNMQAMRYAREHEAAVRQALGERSEALLSAIQAFDYDAAIELLQADAAST